MDRTMQLEVELEALAGCEHDQRAEREDTVCQACGAYTEHLQPCRDCQREQLDTPWDTGPADPIAAPIVG